jgi:hypothetical protein
VIWWGFGGKSGGWIRDGGGGENVFAGGFEIGSGGDVKEDGKQNSDAVVLQNDNDDDDEQDGEEEGDSFHLLFVSVYCGDALFCSLLPAAVSLQIVVFSSTIIIVMGA